MTDRHAKALDDAIARALLDRIKTASGHDAIREDLDRLRHVHARSPTPCLAEALRYLLASLQADDPDRDKFEAELQSLPPEPAQKPPAPVPNQATGPEKVVPLPGTFPEIPPIPAQDAAGTDWPVPPLFDAPWQALDGEDLAGAARVAHACFPGTVAAGKIASIQAARATDLLHYPGFRAVEILFREEDGSEFSHVGLYGPDKALQINGTSPGIHELNAGAAKPNGNGGTRRSPLHLATAEEAASYLRFFCGCVHGAEGPFNIIEAPAQLQARWKGDDGIDALVDNISDLRIRHEAPDLEDDAPQSSGGQAEDARTEETGRPATNGDASAHTSGSASQPAQESPNRAWEAEATILYSNALFSAEFRIMPTGMIEMVDDDPIKAELPVLRDGFSNGLRIARLEPGTSDGGT